MSRRIIQEQQTRSDRGYCNRDHIKVFLLELDDGCRQALVGV